MPDNDIRKIVNIVMFFVRTRHNADAATNEEIFRYVKDKLKEA